MCHLWESVRTKTGVCKHVRCERNTGTHRELCIHKIPKQRMCKPSGSPGQLCQLRLCPVSHAESGTSSSFQSSEFCLLLNIKAQFFIIVTHTPWFPWPNTSLFAKILTRTQVICGFELHFVLALVKNGREWEKSTRFVRNILCLGYIIISFWFFIRKHFRSHFKVKAKSRKNLTQLDFRKKSDTFLW